MSKGIQRVGFVFGLLMVQQAISFPFDTGSSTPKVEVITPIEQSASIEHNIIGQVVAENKVALVSRVTGFLSSKTVTDGAYVKKGESIYQIQPQQYQAELESAKANLDKAKLTYQNSALSLSRQETLLKSNATSQESYDSAKINAEVAKTDILSAQANYDLAELNLSYTKIIAPFAGKLGVANYSEGALIQANSSLNTLIQLDPIEVEFNPSANLYLSHSGNHIDRSLIKVGLKLANAQDYRELGRIVYIGNEIDTATDTIKVKAEFKNSEHLLLPGQTVTVELSKPEAKKWLLIPQKALSFESDKVYVYVLGDDSKVHKQLVITGQSVGANVVVLEGINPKSRVVILGLQNIKDGQTVDVMDQANKKGGL